MIERIEDENYPGIIPLVLVCCKTEKGLIYLADQNNTILTKEEFQRLLKHVNKFYSKVTADKITLHNIQIEKERYEDRNGHSEPSPRKKHVGVIYVARVKNDSGHCKIGRTSDLPARIKGLKLPFEVEILFSIPSDDLVPAERFLHSRFAERRINGEWFSLTEEDIKWLSEQKTLNEDDLFFL